MDELKRNRILVLHLKYYINEIKPCFFLKPIFVLHWSNYWSKSW